MICWSCQQSLQPCDRMRLDSETPIPVCISCWQAIPVHERIKLAMSFNDRASGGVLDELRTLLASSYGGWLDAKGGASSFFNGTGN